MCSTIHFTQLQPLSTTWPSTLATSPNFINHQLHQFGHSLHLQLPVGHLERRHLDQSHQPSTTWTSTSPQVSPFEANEPGPSSGVSPLAKATRKTKTSRACATRFRSSSQESLENLEMLLGKNQNPQGYTEDHGRIWDDIAGIHQFWVWGVFTLGFGDWDGNPN